MTERTYSLGDAAEIICGASGPAEIQWLGKRLRGEAKPHLPGYKVQRQWRMTAEQIDEAIALLTPPRLVSVPPASSMTKTSKRRLMGA